MSLTIAGALQYKTSLAWSSAGDAVVETLTLPDKAIAICTLVYALRINGVTRITEAPGESSPVDYPSFHLVGDVVVASPYGVVGTQTGIRIMRVGSSLVYSALSAVNYPAIYQASVPVASGSGFAAGTKTPVLAMAVPGTVTIQAVDDNWGDGATDSYEGYYHHLHACALQTVIGSGYGGFKNIQIFNSGL